MRYFKYYNNAMTVPGMLGKGRMSMPSLFGFGGFGQTDPVLDAGPGSDEEAVAAEAAADAAASEGQGDLNIPVSRIEFFPDGTVVQRGAVGNTLAVDWWKKLESALGLQTGAGADTVIQAAQDLSSSRKAWKWATMIGIPAAAVAVWFASKRWGR